MPRLRVRLLRRDPPSPGPRSSEGGPAPGAAGVLAPALADFCSARQGRRLVVQRAARAEPGSARERRYWSAAAALQRQDARAALTEVTEGLAQLGALANDELRWRFAVVGALAATRPGDSAAAASLTAMAQKRPTQLRASRNADLDSYTRRLDLAELRTSAGQD